MFRVNIYFMVNFYGDVLILTHIAATRHVTP